MDIACPNCAAAYELDDATVGPKGRKVRCAACGEVWRVMPPNRSRLRRLTLSQPNPLRPKPRRRANGRRTRKPSKGR